MVRIQAITTPGLVHELKRTTRPARLIFAVKRQDVSQLPKIS